MRSTHSENFHPHHKKGTIMSADNTMIFQEREEDVLEAVIPHLKQGLCHFRDLAEMLLNFDEAQIITLKHAIQKGLDMFQLCEAVADQQLREIDKYFEELTNKIGMLESEERRLKPQLDNLENQLKEINDSLQNYSDALKKAECDVSSSKNALDECRSRETYNETIRNVGIGVMFIPFLGLIAGSVMIGVGQTELNRATFEAQQAEEVMNNFQKQVDSFTSEVTAKKQEKSELNEMIEECQRNIWKTKESLKEVKSKQLQISDYQGMFRKAVHFLGLLAGKASVAMVESTQVIVLLEPVCNVMADIVSLFIKTEAENNLFLQDNDLKTSIQSLHDINQRVSAITGKPENPFF
ncbi:major antigen-like [Esox lucius]|uniref:major antigen-like n=1 Tax=Esox lucius TaxID=8010 RepID=UPI0014768CB2|nr:major antigen-like [Esox lucius]